MTGLISFIAEEPVRPNPDVDALQGRAHSRIGIAEFSLDNASRYSFLWPRGDSQFSGQSVELLERISGLLGLPVHGVAAWKHHAVGPLRIRDLGLMSKLRKGKWQVDTRDCAAVAFCKMKAGDFRSAVETALSLRLGWFVAFGSWWGTEVLLQPPFLATILALGQIHRLAPNREFLEAMAGRGGAVAYAVASDDRRSQVILVTARRIREELKPLRAHLDQRRLQ